ncbi:MAG TPA: ATP-binding protein [Conexibacter sp.]|nr:ATP-binding protein [Conexibacter sp.]
MGRVRPTWLNRHHLLSGQARPWLTLYVVARLGASALAAALVVWDGFELADLPLLMYGPLSTALLLALPRLRTMPAVWLADASAVLALVLLSDDWRSPYYPLWLTTLALPAVRLPPRQAVALALLAPLVFFVVAFVGGPSPGDLNLVSSETLAIHLVLPLGLVLGLAYAAEVLRQLLAERRRGEQLAVERERRRIAWELHDSAKQRIHAAHLLISSLRGHGEPAIQPLVERAVVELESASADMDTSLAELRSPLQGRPLQEALLDRARELTTDGGPRIAIHGQVPPLPPLVAAHAYRIGCEALTNALRHANASTIDVTVEEISDGVRLRVHDDGRGMPTRRRSDASGLFTMESRAASIGARLQIGADARGRGTVVLLEVPLDKEMTIA